jgi:diguanylate cyclase (GGDEF)-like protein
MSKRTPARWRLFREVRSRRDFIVEVTRLTALVVVGADLIDLAINLFTGSPYIVLSFVQTTFTATLMSALFLGALTRANLQLFRANEKLEVISRTDPQTGLLNRGTFFEAADQNIAGGRRGYLLLADIDSFKAINDTYGHPAGDAVIERVGRVISLCFPAPFACGRLGGDEFGVVLLGCDRASAERAAESLRRIAAAQCFGDAGLIRATLSIGLAELRAEPAAGRPYAAADKALYCAKRNGRNRVETAAELPQAA